MAKTPEAFYNQYRGKRIDQDGSWGVQCVDGFKVFCVWAGVPVKTTGNGYADGYWYNRNSSGYSKYFTFVTGSSNFRNGDWVMWARGSGSHPKSHIAMYYNGKEFGQNQGSNREFRLINGHFSDALGAFRWKGWQTTTTTQKKSTSAVQESVQVRVDTKYNDAVAKTEEKTETLHRRTDITSVNAGKDYLESPEGIKLFGRITRCVVWDDVTVPANLKTKAQQALNDAVSMAMTLEVDAIDASLLKFEVQRLRLGEKVEVISSPHNLDTMLTLSKMTIPLDRPQDANYTLGANFTAMTEQQLSQSREAYRVTDTVRQMNVTVNEITQEKLAETEQQDKGNVSVDWIEVTEGVE